MNTDDLQEPAHVEELRAENARLSARVAELEGVLADPAALHVNMLRGSVAKLTWEQCCHLYPTERDLANAKLAKVETATRLLIHAVNAMAVGVGVHNERHPAAPIEGPVVNALFSAVTNARATLAELEANNA